MVTIFYTPGLDDPTAIDLMQDVGAYARAKKVAVILTIHQPSREVASHFDHIIIMQQAKVTMNDSPVRSWGPNWGMIDHSRTSSKIPSTEAPAYNGGTATGA